MNRNNLQTIYWKKDYKIKLEDTIKKENLTIKYLNKIIKYFENNNITYYKKFDKRDFNKIQEYLKNMIYYNHCQDNFSISYNTSIIGTKVLYIYINNEKQYNCDIEISCTHLDNSTEYNNVLEIAKNRLEYVKTRYNENKKILKNFDKYMKQYNDKVRNFKKFIDTTHLNNIIDIYIYANEKDGD
jgi:hypothetical protein